MWSLRWRWHLVYINDSVDDHWLDHGAEDIVDDIRRYADDAVISHIFDDNLDINDAVISHIFDDNLDINDAVISHIFDDHLDINDAQQRDPDSVCRHWRPSGDRGRRRHG